MLGVLQIHLDEFVGYAEQRQEQAGAMRMSGERVIIELHSLCPLDGPQARVAALVLPTMWDCYLSSREAVAVINSLFRLVE